MNEAVYVRHPMRTIAEVGSIIAVLMAMAAIVYNMGVEAGNQADIKATQIVHSQQLNQLSMQQQTTTVQVEERLARIEAQLDDIRAAVREQGDRQPHRRMP